MSNKVLSGSNIHSGNYDDVQNQIIDFLCSSEDNNKKDRKKVASRKKNIVHILSEKSNEIMAYACLHLKKNKVYINSYVISPSISNSQKFLDYILDYIDISYSGRSVKVIAAVDNKYLDLYRFNDFLPDGSSKFTKRDKKIPKDDSKIILSRFFNLKRSMSGFEKVSLGLLISLTVVAVVTGTYRLSHFSLWRVQLYPLSFLLTNVISLFLFLLLPLSGIYAEMIQGSTFLRRRVQRFVKKRPQIFKFLFTAVVIICQSLFFLILLFVPTVLFEHQNIATYSLITTFINFIVGVAYEYFYVKEISLFFFQEEYPDFGLQQILCESLLAVLSVVTLIISLAEKASPGASFWLVALVECGFIDGLVVMICVLKLNQAKRKNNSLKENQGI